MSNEYLLFGSAYRLTGSFNLPDLEPQVYAFDNWEASSYN